VLIFSCGFPVAAFWPKGKEMIPLSGAYGLASQIGSVEYARAAAVSVETRLLVGLHTRALGKHTGRTV
jgi:predicted metal-dependent TIM-barrel fold hydrolase